MNAQRILDIVKSEIAPSNGCTEPAAIGFASAYAAKLAGGSPTRIDVVMSSCLYKNAFCVKIPGASRSGIELAICLGTLVAEPERKLEIFDGVTDAVFLEARSLSNQGIITIDVRENPSFYLEINLASDHGTSRVITSGQHTNVTLLENNGQVLFEKSNASGDKNHAHMLELYKAMTIDQLIDIAEATPLTDIIFIREAVQVNTQVSLRGLHSELGLGVGRGLQHMIDEGSLEDNLVNRVKVAVASGCDFRMGAGNASVMTVVGSGNQGFASVLPVATTADYLGLSEEKSVRGVLLSILISIYIKYHVGRLSPICSAVFTGAASAGAIAWLMDGNRAAVKGAIGNVLGNLTGMICDGAKDGCALKLSCCASEAVIAAKLALSGFIIQPTDGIIASTIEETIGHLAQLASDGMAHADKSMIAMMLKKNSNTTSNPVSA